MPNLFKAFLITNAKKEKRVCAYNLIDQAFGVK